MVRSGKATPSRSARTFLINQTSCGPYSGSGEGRVRVRLVCDLSQAKGKTKMQLQALQEGWTFVWLRGSLSVTPT